MTKIYVWPDGTYLDADEYNEVEFNHKGDDYTVIDLQDIAAGRTTLVETGGFFTVVPVFECRLSELLQAEHQLKSATTMFRNYRNTMREYTWQIPMLRATIEQLQKDYALALRRITELETSTSSAEVQRLSKEMSDVIASKDHEIKTILTARDQWVKELHVKLREATESDSEELLGENRRLRAQLAAQYQEIKELHVKLRMAATESEQATAANSEQAEENRRLKSQLAGATARIRKQIDGYGKPPLSAKDLQIKLHMAHEKATFCAKERDECAAKVVNLETLLSELYQVLGALDAPTEVLDLVTKVLDGHGFDPETDSLLPFYIEVQPIRPEDDWEYRAITAEAELAKMKEVSDISSDIEDNLRKERDWYDKLLTRHGVCTDCGDMYEHHEDEPLASCICQTAEWGNGVSTPYMALQRALREARDAGQCQAEKVDELKGEIAEMKRIAAFAIATLQEIE